MKGQTSLMAYYILRTNKKAMSIKDEAKKYKKQGKKSVDLFFVPESCFRHLDFSNSHSRLKQVIKPKPAKDKWLQNFEDDEHVAFRTRCFLK